MSFGHTISKAFSWLSPANSVADYFFKKDKHQKAADLPNPPQFGDPAVRQADNDLRLQQKSGYAGTVLTGDTSQAIANRSLLAKALGMQPVAATTPAAATPGTNWQTLIAGGLPIGVNVGNPLP